MSSNAIVFAGLMPHAPVLVPAVGREQSALVRASVTAMQQVALGALAAAPDSLLLVSPHSPRRADAFGIWALPRLRGSFESFGSSDIQIDVPLDDALVEQLEREAHQRGLRTWRITHGLLDHGALVPLVFLQAAGWHGPTVIVSLSDAGGTVLDLLGQAIAASAGKVPRRLAVIASGDMSHRLTPSAPCGFHPDGPRFDADLLTALRCGAPGALRDLDPLRREHAAEDVVDSTRVALAATEFSALGRTVLSYEGPFGVGYGIAILSTGGNPAADPPGTASSVQAPWPRRLADLPLLARRAVEAHFAGGPDQPPYSASGELQEPRGVFVTVRMEHGELRGCRGSSAPDDVVLQTWQHARSAALRDFRFTPIQQEELPRVRFTVNVLSELEPVGSVAELDPARFGVVVTSVDGRSALLLPRIPGIDRIEDQLRCVRQKAGIAQHDHVQLQRFTTQVLDESDAPNPSP